MPSGQCGIMSDDEDKLALVGEEPQRRFFVDSCVFYLVDEDDRAVTDAARSAIISARVWPPLRRFKLSSGRTGSGVIWFAMVNTSSGRSRMVPALAVEL